MQPPIHRKALLLTLLNEGGEFTLDDLTEKLSLASDRQVRRLIASLLKEGVSIRTKRKNRIKYFWIPADLRPVSIPLHELVLQEDEALALAVAAEAAGATLAPTPLQSPLKRAFGRLMERLGPNVFTFESEEMPLRWHFDTVAATEIAPSVFSTITRAVSELHSVRIDYLTASTGEFWPGRKVDPYGIAVRGSSWLLVAFCHMKRAVLDFSLAGISAVVFCDDKVESALFTVPETFDLAAHFRDRFTALSGARVYEVRLLAEPDRAPYFRRKLYHPTQQIETVRDDGRIVVSYEVAGLEEIRSFVQSWGVGLTVLEPPELVERIRGEAEEIERRYRNSTMGESE